MIWFTSDFHFGHDRRFIYGPRGFSNIYDHDKAIIKNWNDLINEDDTVYILGDLMLGDKDYGRSCFNQLKGMKEIIIGNHDTKARIELYKDMRGVIDIKVADLLDYSGWHFYLSHYPTFTSSLEKDDIKRCLIDLYGHVHEKEKFYQDIPFMYNVGLDANDNMPVSIEQVIEAVKEKAKECFKMLDDKNK